MKAGWLRFLAACMLAGALAAGRPADGTFAALDAYLREEMAATGIPGAAIAVVRDGQQVHAAAYGRADGSGRAMGTGTPVLLASTTKSLTAIAVMQQVEAGRLDLDEPVTTYLPWFTLRDGRAGDIRLRHLLYQTSGLSARDGAASDVSDTQEPAALEQWVRKLAGARLDRAPGEGFTYSNANYNILGLVVQAVSGRPFGDYVAGQVFGPLDMRHSHTTRAAAAADGLAAGHMRWFGTLWRPTGVPAPTAGMASTTMYASAEDLGHELAALLDGGRYRDRRILTPASVELMLDPGTRVDASTQYAMGWFVRPLTEAAGPAAPDAGSLPVVLEHHGEGSTTHTYQAMVPSSGLGVALVVNGNDPSAPSRLKAVDSNILRILHGQAPVPAGPREDPLQRYGWLLALGFLLAELASAALAAALLRRPAARRRRKAVLYCVPALALDALLVWLCLVHVPDRFGAQIWVIMRQIPDVGAALAPALALALLWPVPRTVWLLAPGRRAEGPGGTDPASATVRRPARPGRPAPPGRGPRDGSSPAC